MKLGFLHACPCCNSDDIQHTPGFVFPFVAQRIHGKPFLETRSDEYYDIQLETSLIGTFSVGCANCGFVGNAVRYTAEQMQNLYSNYRDERYDRERTFFEKSYAERAGKLEVAYPYLGVIEQELAITCGSIKSVIDVGGASGVNCPFRNDAMTECYVTDVSGKQLLEGVERWDGIRNQFDLVYCSNVLEHIPDVFDFVMSELMQFDSRYLYIEVPYFEPKLDSSGFPHPKLGWHEHINYFSKKSLIQLCRRLGLGAVKFLELSSGGDLVSRGVVIAR